MTKIVKDGPKLYLGAGSYDYDALREATDAVAAGDHESADHAQAAMNDAVAAHDRNPGATADPRETPGYKWVTRKGSTGEKERIQVPVESDEADGDAPEKAKGGSKAKAAAADQDQNAAPTGAKGE